MNASKAFGYAKDLMSLLVIPLLLWGIKLEVGNALRDERIGDLEDDLAEAQEVNDKVQSNSERLIRVETKIDNVNDLAADIKSLVKELGG